MSRRNVEEEKTAFLRRWMDQNDLAAGEFAPDAHSHISNKTAGTEK